MINSMAQVFTEVINFFETRVVFRRFWVKGSRPPETILAEMYHFYRRTRPTVVQDNPYQVQQ